MEPLTMATAVTVDEQPSGFLGRINRFFYAEEIPYGLALTRILLPWALIASLLPRWSRARELFSLDGVSMPLWENYGHAGMLPEISGTVAVGMITLLLFSLVTTSIGWCTRVSSLIAFFCYTYLTMLDAVTTMTKYSVIASHLLLILAFSGCHRIWSVDCWLSRRKKLLSGESQEVADDDVRASVWPRRLLQLLFGAIYFGSAITKFQTAGYFTSDQLTSWMLTNMYFSNPIGEWMTQFSALLVVMAYVAVIWEMLFLFLCWRGLSRHVMIFLGVAFHLSTIFMLGLRVFPFVCCSVYFVFYDEENFRRGGLIVRRLWSRWGWQRGGSTAETSSVTTPDVAGSMGIPSPVLFCGIAALLIVAGIELEHRIDPYGVRRAEGPYPLKEVDSAWVEQILQNESTTVRPEDVIADFRAGTVLIGGVIANPQRQFRHGDRVIVQAVLSPPHEDMILQCDLHDANNHIVASQSMGIATRSMLRCNTTYSLPNSLAPGEYALVLKRFGRELLRKRIHISGQGKTVANHRKVVHH